MWTNHIRSYTCNIILSKLVTAHKSFITFLRHQPSAPSTMPREVGWHLQPARGAKSDYHACRMMLDVENLLESCAHWSSLINKIKYYWCCLATSSDSWHSLKSHSWISGWQGTVWCDMIHSFSYRIRPIRSRICVIIQFVPSFSFWFFLNSRVTFIHWWTKDLHIDIHTVWTRKYIKYGI